MAGWKENKNSVKYLGGCGGGQDQGLLADNENLRDGIGQLELNATGY